MLLVNSPSTQLALFQAITNFMCMRNLQKCFEKKRKKEKNTKKTFNLVNFLKFSQGFFFVSTNTTSTTTAAATSSDATSTKQIP